MDNPRVRHKLVAYSRDVSDTWRRRNDVAKQLEHCSLKVQTPKGHFPNLTVADEILGCRLVGW